jgi:hypothetical protein
MTNASMTFGRPTRLAIPRGAIWLGSFAAALIHALRRLDNWLLSERRDNPKTAEEVMDWANRIESTEPGFAADLRAAALRSMSGPDRG